MTIVHYKPTRANYKSYNAALDVIIANAKQV